MDPAELDRLVPAARRNIHMLKLLLTFKLGDLLRRRARNRMLVRLAFEKWHMDAEAKGEDHVEGHYHALRVMELRNKLTELESKD